MCFFSAYADAGLFADEKPEIVINGVNEPLENNIRAFLALQHESCTSPKWKIENQLGKSPEQIKSALKALGYYHPQIETQLQWTDTCWQLTLTINTGKPVRLRTIEVKITGPGSQQDFYTQSSHHLTITPGDILNHAQYEAVKSKLIAISEAQGYFAYVLEKHQLRVDVQLNQADIIMHFNTGPRYYFGTISINQTILDPLFVSKYVTIVPGQPYQRESIAETHFALDGSGYFRQVQVKYSEKQAVNYIAPVDIVLQALPRHELALGVGYDTDLGFRGSAEYRNRYVNRSGHRFETTMSAAQRKSYIFLDYQIPLFDPRKQKLAFTASFVYEDTENILSETYSLGMRYTENFKKDQVLTSQLNFVAERFDSGASQDTFTLMLVPGVSWSNVIAQDKGFFMQGFKYAVQLQGAEEHLLSDVSFAQILFKCKFVKTLPWRSKVIMRTDLGATAVNDFNTLPTSYRFYAGGDNSVRGYKYKSIGAVNAQGEVIGGKFLSVASIEYEQLLYQQWSLAVFADAGDAFSDRWDLKLGIGWGIRWYSLVGPIQVDMAFPSENWQDFRFHFSFSTAL